MVEEEGTRLGLALAAEPGGPTLEVDILAALPDAQRRGIGRQMIGFAEAPTRRLGLPALRLSTHVTMAENLRFYPRLGFRQIGGRNDDGVERVYFEKALH